MRSSPLKGFTVTELIITIGVVIILAAIAVPSYTSYTRRAYYSQIVQATVPYKTKVTECVQKLKTLIGCSAGANNIPPAVATAKGAVKTLSVVNGLIIATPMPTKAIAESDNYVLTPTYDAAAETVKWSSAGEAVKKRYAQ